MAIGIFSRWNLEKLSGVRLKCPVCEEDVDSSVEQQLSEAEIDTYPLSDMYIPS